MGADNVANRSAALEPDFHANTINTTWYSNGEQLTGNNIPGTCTYDAALTPPTPAPRAGYVFNGWTLRVPAAPVVTDCGISELSHNIDYSAYAAKRLDGGDDFTSGGATAATYGITQAGEWGVTLSYGKITGVSSCNSSIPETYTYWYGEHHCEEHCYEIPGIEMDPYAMMTCTEECQLRAENAGMQWNPSDDGIASVNTFSSGVNGQYCWCRVTGYAPNGESQCSTSSLPWVFVGEFGDFTSSSGCAIGCSSACSRLFNHEWSYVYYLYGHSDSE